MTKRIPEPFRIVFGLVRPLMPDVAIRPVIGSREIEEAHRKDERVFAATVTYQGRPNVFEVHFAKDFERLAPGFQFGITIHELGHLVALHLHDNHEESAADLSVLGHWGIPLEHVSRLNLQFITSDLIDTLYRVYEQGGTLDDIQWASTMDESSRRRLLNVDPYER